MSRLDWSHIGQCSDCHRSDTPCPDHRPSNRVRARDVVTIVLAAGWLIGWLVYAGAGR